LIENGSEDDENIDHAKELSVSLEEKNCSNLLRRSYTLLADYYFRIVDYSKAAKAYARSDSKLSYVASRLLSAKNAEEALIQYLDAVLFDPDMVDLMEQDSTLANKILDHYYNYAPQNLGRLILESSLTSYSLDTAVAILEKVREDLKMSDWSFLMASALVELDNGNIKSAKHHLVSLPQENLVKYCSNNPKLLIPEAQKDEEGDEEYGYHQESTNEKQDTTEKIQNSKQDSSSHNGTAENNAIPPPTQRPSLASLLRQAAPWALIEILIRLQDHFLPEISLPVLVQPENGDYHIANQNKLLEMCYLEAIVLEKRKNAEDYLTELREYFTKLAQLYLDCIYLPANEKDDLLTQISDEPAPRQTTDQQDKATLQKGQDSKKKRRSKKKTKKKGRSISALNRHLQKSKEPPTFENAWKQFHFKTFSRREGWLDILPPFVDFDDIASQDGRRHFDTSVHNHFYVRKLQGLFCSDIERDNGKMLDLITECSKRSTENPLNNDITVSFQVLLLPTQNKLYDAMVLLVKSYPRVVLDYSKHYCHSADDWNILLKYMLGLIIEADNIGDRRTEEVLTQVYGSVLDYLTLSFSPSIFFATVARLWFYGIFLAIHSKSFFSIQVTTVNITYTKRSHQRSRATGSTTTALIG